MPPYLAGRESEQALGLRLLQRLLNSNTPEQAPRGDAVVIYGPRGNGKTVWLTWLGQQAKSLGMEVIDITPKTTPSREALIKTVLPDSWWKNLTEFTATIKGMGLSLVRGQVDNLQDALSARCAKSPTLCLLDEAHTLPEQYGAELLNVTQNLIRQNHAFLFVAAGTPGVVEYLHDINATFDERCRSIPFGRLSGEATCAAFTEPLHGWQFEQGVLDRLRTDSQRYPYFIQLWGEAIWEFCHQRQRVSLSDLKSCQPVVDRVRTLFYARRYHELESDLPHPISVALARAFAQNDTLTTKAVELSLRHALTEQGMESGHTAIKRVRDDLQRMGYLWEVTNEAGTSTLWEPGIPSLMKYVLSEGQQDDAKSGAPSEV